MVGYLLRRHDLYLSEVYQWASIPHAFNWWEADRLQHLFNQWTDKPTHYVYVTGKSVDLDAVEWMRM